MSKDQIKKDTRPTLEKILEFSQRNQSQLCDLLSDSVVANRVIKSWTDHQVKKRNELSRKQRILDHKSQNLDVELVELDVRYAKGMLEKRKFESELLGEEKIESQRRKAVFDIVKQMMITPEKEVSSGNMQMINTHIKQKLGEIEEQLFPGIKNREGK